MPRAGPDDSGPWSEVIAMPGAAENGLGRFPPAANIGCRSPNVRHSSPGPSWAELGKPAPSSHRAVPAHLSVGRTPRPSAARFLRGGGLPVVLFLGAALGGTTGLGPALAALIWFAVTSGRNDDRSYTQRLQQWGQRFDAADAELSSRLSSLKTPCKRDRLALCPPLPPPA